MNLPDYGCSSGESSMKMVAMTASEDSFEGYKQGANGTVSIHNFRVLLGETERLWACPECTITRPKFVERLITGASSLTSISSFRTKGYKRQLSLELPKTSSSQDNASVNSFCKDDTILENIHETTHVDTVLFCPQCGLQIFNEDVKQLSFKSHGSVVACSACKEKDGGQLCVGTINSSSCSVVGLQPVDTRSSSVNFKSEFVNSESESVNFESVDCWQESLDSRPKCADCKSEFVHFQPDCVDCVSESVVCASDLVNCESYPLVSKQESVDNTSKSLNCQPVTVEYRLVNTDNSPLSGNEWSHPEDSSEHQYYLSENRETRSAFVFCGSESELNESECIVDGRSSGSENRSQTECKSEPVDCWSEKATEKSRIQVCKSEDADGISVSKEDSVDGILHTVTTSIFQCEGENHEDCNPDFVTSASQYSLFNTEGLEDTDLDSGSLKSLCVDSRQDSQSTAIVISPGFVRRQCEAFSRPSQSLHASPCGADKNGQQLRKEQQIVLLTSSVKSVQTRLQGCPAENTKQWQKSYYSLAWDSKFHKQVMAKGYVKALAEQINHQGSLTNMKDEEPHEGGPEDGKMSTSFVHTFIQAAEVQQLKENALVCVAKKPGFSSTSSLSNNGSHSERVVSGNAQQTSKELTMKDGEPQYSSETEKPASQQRNETVPVFQSPHSSSNSSCAKLQCNKFVTPSQKSSLKFLPNDSVYIPRSPTRPQQSFNRHKPDVDYTSKPKSNKMSSMDTELKNCENSTLLSPTSLSSPTRKSAEAPSPSSLSSGSSHPTVPCASDKSSSASENDAGNICQSSYDTQSSSHSHTKGDQVSLNSEAKQNNDQYSDYDNAPPLNAAELFDSSWSDTDSLDEFSDEDGDNDDRKVTALNLLVDDQLKTKNPDELQGHHEDKRFRIAEELLLTEKDYVGRLHLLHQVFFFRLDSENRQQAFLPTDTLQHMFSNTKSIFHFHHDFVLPQLEGRMKNWKKDPRVGDLMKKNAPFLKMYTEYIRNFDRAMKLINHWLEKSARFSEIIQDIQKLPECGNLSLQHHMLGPIQRVPRYELLLKDYVKHLPVDSPDMSDSKEALDLVTKAACHSNEAMKKIETFHKLLDIYQSLRGVPVDFISPTREFVTQGPVIKIAARSGERQLRQIFLFNDLVLICSQYNLLGTYNVRSFLEVESMEIRHGTNMHIPNTFLLHSKQKAVELLDENPAGESFGWQDKIHTVIGKHRERKKSIRQEEPREFTSDTNVPESCLGKTAPIWIQDDAATMCMLCMLPFNVVRRRHHCRACGKLICKTCCKKAPLEYMKGKIDRVCTACYNVIVNKQRMTASDSSTGETSPKKKGILQVKASEPGLISGYMHCSEDSGHSWQHLWITAHKDFVLYSFKAHQDVSAISSLPLPGHEVTQIWDIESKPYVFCLSHKMKRVCMFQSDNDKHLKRWMFVLEKLVRAELPEDSSRLSSQSNSSNSSSASDSGTNNDYNPSSTGSSSQADLGQPCSNSSSLSTLAVDDGNQDNADGISQYDNVDGVVTE